MEYRDDWISGAIGKLDQFVVTRSPDLLHEARVVMKKLLSRYWYLKQCGKRKNRDDYFRQWKELFQLAGEIRKCHVLKEKAEQYKLPMLIQDEELERSFSEFNKRYPVLRRKLMCCPKKVSMKISKPDRKGFVKLLMKQRKKALCLLHSTAPNASWHCSRKILKRATCLYQLADKKKRLQENKSFDLITLNAIHSRLGEWHDLKMCLSLIHKTGKQSESTIAAVDKMENDLLLAEFTILMLLQAIKPACGD